MIQKKYIYLLSFFWPIGYCHMKNRYRVFRMVKSGRLYYDLIFPSGYRQLYSRGLTQQALVTQTLHIPKKELALD